MSSFWPKLNGEGFGWSKGVVEKILSVEEEEMISWLK